VTAVVFSSESAVVFSERCSLSFSERCSLSAHQLVSALTQPPLSFSLILSHSLSLSNNKKNESKDNFSFSLISIFVDFSIMLDSDLCVGHEHILHTISMRACS